MKEHCTPEDTQQIIRGSGNVDRYRREVEAIFGIVMPFLRKLRVKERQSRVFQVPLHGIYTGLAHLPGDQPLETGVSGTLDVDNVEGMWVITVGTLITPGSHTIWKFTGPYDGYRLTLPAWYTKAVRDALPEFLRVVGEIAPRIHEQLSFFRMAGTWK